jgi:hypothetical protein
MLWAPELPVSEVFTEVDSGLPDWVDSMELLDSVPLALEDWVVYMEPLDLEA